MSIPDSSLPGNKYSALERKQFPTLLSLNDVLQESLRKAQAQVDKVKLVLRCETLPVIIADHDEMVNLFDELLAMILNHQVDATRLFLFIYCQEDTTDFIDMTLEAGLRRYCINFHTNVATHENWKLVNSQGLVNCKQILSRYNGNLAVNDISSTGCLFSVLLPGKIE